MSYKIREIAGGRFGVYTVADTGDERLYKTFKTRKSAENWIAKH